MGEVYEPTGNRANARGPGVRQRLPNLTFTPKEEKQYLKFMAKRGWTKKMLQETL